MTSIEEIFPPFGLRLRCGPLELRCVREDDIQEISELIAGGIYDAEDFLPFLRRWAEDPPELIPANTMRFYWGTFAAFQPEAWHLVLAVREHGRIVGVQDLVTKNFPITRSIDTGSWLGRPHQGRGLGTLMRQAVCAFGFDELGAVQMASGYLDENHRSAGVSRKVGYTFNGRVRMVHPDGGQVRVEEKVLLLPQNFNRAPHPLEVAGADAFRSFIGL